MYERQPIDVMFLSFSSSLCSFLSKNKEINLVLEKEVRSGADLCNIWGKCALTEGTVCRRPCGEQESHLKHSKEGRVVVAEQVRAESSKDGEIMSALVGYGQGFGCFFD